MFFAPVLRTRYVPSRPVFDRRVEEFFHRALQPAQGVQLKEEDQAWTVTLDMPGISREDLSITVEGPVVRLETRKEAARQYKAYELPQDIDVDATNARLENGVLTLTLAKQKPASRARSIPLN